MVHPSASSVESEMSCTQKMISSLLEDNVSLRARIGLESSAASVSVLPVIGAWS